MKMPARDRRHFLSDERERAVLPVIASAAKQSISPREERNGLLRRKGSSQ
jgi:hypothetical protein